MEEICSKNWQKMDIKISILLIILTGSILIEGCASSYSTLKAKDNALKTRYYNASYDTVINAATRAAAEMENWEIQDVDEEQGLITVINSDFWRTYIIKIFIKETKNKKVSVDVLSYVSADIVAANKEFISKFLERLNDLLK